MASSKRSLQQQYSELQGNFARWQQQLNDNQALLNKTESPSTTAAGKPPAKAPAAQKKTLRSPRRATIDVGDARKVLLEEIQRRGKMMEENSSSGDAGKENTSNQAHVSFDCTVTCI